MPPEVLTALYSVSTRLPSKTGTSSCSWDSSLPAVEILSRTNIRQKKYWSCRRAHETCMSVHTKYEFFTLLISLRAHGVLKPEIVAQDPLLLQEGSVMSGKKSAHLNEHWPHSDISSQYCTKELKCERKWNAVFKYNATKIY